MRHRTITLLGLACLVLAFKGDSCLIEKRTVDVVVSGDIPQTWHTTGSSSSGTSTQVVNANGFVEDALDRLSGDAHLDSVHVSGVCYEVLQNNGFVGAHSGSVSVDGHPLLTFSAPSNATGVTGGSEGAEVALVKEGADYVNNLLNQYLTQYNATHSPDPNILDNLTFVANWTSATPTTAYDFEWKTCLILQIVGTVSVKVPNP